jgi:hypothetical protein
VLGVDPEAEVEASALVAPHELGFETSLAPPHKRTRPDRYGWIRSAKTRRAQVEEADDRFLRDGVLAQLPLPDWLTPDALPRYIRERNGSPTFRELKKRIDDEAVKILEAKASSENSPNRGIQDGLHSLRDETNALRRRERLLATQRFGQFRWASPCSLRGNHPLDVAQQLARASLWEIVQLAAVSTVTVPRVIEEAKRSESRHALDQVARAYRKAFAAVAGPADRVTWARERILLLLDTWNAGSVGAVYEPKSWQSARVPARSLAAFLLELRTATSALEAELVRSYGQAALLTILRPTGDELPLARELLPAMVAEDAA